MTDDEVHSALVRWLAALLGVTAIKAHQGGKAPALPYVMVNMTGTAPVRVHEQRVAYEDADTGDMDTGDIYPPVTARPAVEAEWRFSVHAYGARPTDLLRPVVSASKLSQVMEPMLPGLVIHEISQIRNVPDWINERWQPRAQMDIYLRGVTRDGHVIDVIEQAQFDHQRLA